MLLGRSGVRGGVGTWRLPKGHRSWGSKPPFLPRRSLREVSGSSFPQGKPGSTPRILGVHREAPSHRSLREEGTRRPRAREMRKAKNPRSLMGQTSWATRGRAVMFGNVSRGREASPPCTSPSRTTRTPRGRRLPLAAPAQSVYSSSGHPWSPRGCCHHGALRGMGCRNGPGRRGEGRR